MGYYDDYYFKQPTVGELRAKAEKMIKKANKKGENWNPVPVIDGRKIAKSWWGKAWCDNLERYADYDNRLERGRRYVRHGAVVDLDITEGKVTAKVMGSGSEPYDINVDISPLSEEKVNRIIDECSGRLANAEALISGKFPDELKELFLEKGMLFPTPQEIKFSCSCPDWAYMCKHVAAVLYGVGARLDTDPVLFFTLRRINISEFVDAALMNRVETMLANADAKSQRIMDKNEIDGLFGVI